MRAGIVQLHRTVELAAGAPATPATLPPELFERSPHPSITEMLPLVDPDDTAAEWAAQEPLPEYGRNPYADRIGAEMAVEGEDSVTALPLAGGRGEVRSGGEAVAATATHYPYAAPGLAGDLNGEVHHALLNTPTPLSLYRDPAATPESSARGETDPTPAGNRARNQDHEPALPVHTLSADVQAEEIAQAVSVAVAYFEDSLGTPPPVLLSAGPLGADELGRMLREQGMAQAEGLRTRELVESAALAANTVTAASTAQIPRGWLAGVVGALQS